MKVRRKGRVIKATQFKKMGDHPKVTTTMDGTIACLKPEGYFKISEGDFILESEEGMVLDILSPAEFEARYDVVEEDVEAGEEDAEAGEEMKSESENHDVTEKAE